MSNSELKKLPNVESVKYQSRETIANDMMKSSEDFKNIMSEWSEGESPIQSAFQVKVKDIKTIGKTADKIKTIDKVDTVEEESIKQEKDDQVSDQDKEN